MCTCLRVYLRSGLSIGCGDSHSHGAEIESVTIQTQRDEVATLLEQTEAWLSEQRESAQRVRSSPPPCDD